MPVFNGSLNFSPKMCKTSKVLSSTHKYIMLKKNAFLECFSLCWEGIETAGCYHISRTLKLLVSCGKKWLVYEDIPGNIARFTVHDFVVASACPQYTCMFSYRYHTYPYSIVSHTDLQYSWPYFRHCHIEYVTLFVSWWKLNHQTQLYKHVQRVKTTTFHDICNGGVHNVY